MPEDPQGRMDILVRRLADELGNRFHAATRIDVREVLGELAENLIEDMGIPKTPVTANSILRAALKMPDRKRRLRRVV
jgi:hypothetical protein